MTRSGRRLTRLNDQLRSVVFTKECRANVPSDCWRCPLHGDSAMNYRPATGNYIFQSSDTAAIKPRLAFARELLKPAQPDAVDAQPNYSGQTPRNLAFG